MKTIKQLFASAGIAALLAFTVTPAFAQSGMMDAEFAHFDGNLTTDLIDPVTVLNTVGDAETAVAIPDLRLNPPSMNTQEWKAYGDQLEVALASGHDGVQNAALRLVIAYSDGEWQLFH